jgi:hypothetical protein
MRRLSWVLVIVILASFGLSLVAISQENEQTRLMNTKSFGNYNNAKKIKKSGKVTLKIWGPWLEHAERVSRSGEFTKSTLIGPEPETLEVNYDEIWVSIYDELFTPAEKKKWKGKFDIYKFYWDKGKVLALIVEKYFVRNPITNKKVGKHEITMIYDRTSILNELK